MEYWTKTRNKNFLTHYSTIPLFQWVWFIVHRLTFIVLTKGGFESEEKRCDQYKGGFRVF